MMLRALVLSACVLVPGALAAVLAREPRQTFPHAAHERVVPLCTGCHAGIPEGDVARRFPSPQTCARCHDGGALERADWQEPARTPTNVTFDHVVHQREVAAEGASLACESCHTPAGARWMVVERAVVPQCLACHAHEADAHLVDADCSTCHMPLAETSFDAQRIALLPAPPDHAEPGFLARLHGERAQRSIETCAVCHTRERCTSCHVDPSFVEAIGEMPAAPALEQPIRDASYPLPPSHVQPAFLERHGARASVQACGTCHTRDDCAACHTVNAPAPVAQLALRRDAVAPGARVERSAPPSHAAVSFSTMHGSLAATRPAACTTCHARTECEQCHSQAQSRAADVAGAALAGAAHRPPERTDSAQARATELAVMRGLQHVRSVDTAAVRAAGLVHEPRTASRRESRGREERPPERIARPEAAYHPPDFTLRHSSLAYGRRLECSNCHDTRAFCADCHARLGMRATGRLGPGFHDAEPLWLLRHGQAARQGLESCASCHRQNDCRQCHSELGAFRISPHGPGFDARRARARNAAACFLCHLSDPIGR